MSIFNFFKTEEKEEEKEEDIIAYKDCYDFLVQKFPVVEKEAISYFTNHVCCGYSFFTKKALSEAFKCRLITIIIQKEIDLLEKNIDNNLLEKVFGLNKKFLENNFGDVKLNPKLKEYKITYYGKRYGDDHINILFNLNDEFRDVDTLRCWPKIASKLYYDIQLKLRKPYRPHFSLATSVSDEELLENRMVDLHRIVFSSFQDAVKKCSFLETIHSVLKKYSESKKTGEILNEELPITITFTYTNEPPKKIYFQYFKDYMAYVKSDKLSQFGIS